MDAIQARSGTKRRSVLAVMALGMLFVLAGCDTTSMFMGMEVPGTTEQACRVEAWWQRSICTAADSMHNGSQLQGLAGRVYLFGSDLNKATPLVGDGEIVVGLYDDTPQPGVTGPVEIHEWTIDPETLKRLLVKDMVGYGYTLFLPWPEGKPIFTHVRLKVRYNQKGRAPLFYESEPITLEGAQTPNQQLTHSVKPGGR